MFKTSSVADPDPFDTDPDLPFHFDTDPNPDSAVHFYIGLDLNPTV